MKTDNRKESGIKETCAELLELTGLFKAEIKLKSHKDIQDIELKQEELSNKLEELKNIAMDDSSLLLTSLEQSIQELGILLKSLDDKYEVTKDSLFNVKY